MFAGLIASMMVLPSPPTTHVLSGQVENGIYVLRPDPNVRYSMIVVPADPFVERPSDRDAEVARQKLISTLELSQQKEEDLILYLKPYLGPADAKLLAEIESLRREIEELKKKLNEKSK
ncbi:MAG: hypothetical protein ACJ8C4_15830 [Gemmataceae bacterium]